MYSIKPFVNFQEDLKRIQKRGYDISLLIDVLKLLAAGKSLPAKYKDYNLNGAYEGCRGVSYNTRLAFNIWNFWKKLFLYLTQTRTHSDLF